MKEAYLYDRLEDERVQCALCNHRCVIKSGKRGICGVRENQGGTLYSLVYGKVIAAHTDPIEKKPLFHFLPGTQSFSIATVGCNFKCRFCQNADISQMPADAGRIMGQDTTPEAILAAALESGADSISYTYTEPTIFFELALDTALIADKRGLKNVFVSNGYMTPECLESIYPHLHAANVDLKAFTDRFYKDMCKAKLAPVLKTLETMKKLNVWLEVTTLLIPGHNDDEGELRELAGFLANLDPEIPWHISRFYPTYKLLDAPPTPPASIRKARDIGYEAGIRYVYTGNIPGEEGEKTFCPDCGELLIDRFGFQVGRVRIEDGKCPKCGGAVSGVWSR